jgi:5-formyltetrahydrofolate cyclo-ligase
LDWLLISDGQEVRPGPFGIREPAGIPVGRGGAPLADCTALFLPALAIDEHGYRLGQGGGFYDRTFARLKASPGPPALVGIAYRQQEVEAVPAGPLDQTLDGILTETGYIPARKDT